MYFPWNIDVASEAAYHTPYAASPLLPLLLISLASQKHSPRTKSDFRDVYDYIIVGAGSAGSVVASRLSELPCISVLLLEAGKAPPRLTEIPAISDSFHISDVSWSFLSTPQRYTAAAMQDRRLPWAGGKMLGGTSSLNGMVYSRGNRRNYDEWAAVGADGWSYEDVLPYFKKLENYTDPKYVSNGFHGTEGPITITRPSYFPEKKQPVIDAALNEGYKFVDPTAWEQIGLYDYQSTTRKGQRCGTAKAYLVPAENRPNLDIVQNVTVTKVLISNKEAVGVYLDYDGRSRWVSAAKEVILSAGTINTPKLLMLSGIGPMSELQKHNIPFVADLPVGLNFQDHPATGLLYQVNSNMPRFYNEIRKESNIMDYCNNRTGPLISLQGNILMAYLRNSDKDIDGIPDHHLYFSDYANYPGSVGTNASFIICLVELVNSYSIGTVSLHSADPYDNPEIDPNYYADFRDISSMVEGLKKCNRIMSNPALKRIGAKPASTQFPECKEFAADEDLYLRCLVRMFVIPTYHQVGTSRMGDPKDPRTVVDPQLRVKGINRLRVVDSSIMPINPSGSTNIPTIMVAEKASDIIKCTIKCLPEPILNWRSWWN